MTKRAPLAELFVLHSLNLNDQSAPVKSKIHYLDRTSVDWSRRFPEYRLRKRPGSTQFTVLGAVQRPADTLVVLAMALAGSNDPILRTGLSCELGDRDGAQLSLIHGLNLAERFRQISRSTGVATLDPRDVSVDRTDNL